MKNAIEWLQSICKAFPSFFHRVTAFHIENIHQSVALHRIVRRHHHGSSTIAGSDQRAL